MLLIGATIAFVIGRIGIAQNETKRIVTYSALSRSGYVIAALSASTYAAGLFHLMTHAFFKALPFFDTGSVIISMYHDPEVRNMGNMHRYIPISHWAALLDSLALIGFPGFSGFFSKDAIIEAVHYSEIVSGANGRLET